jgi:hypothetical protein
MDNYFCFKFIAQSLITPLPILNYLIYNFLKQQVLKNLFLITLG